MTAKTQNSSFLQLAKELFYLYRPYFGLHKSKKWRTLSAICVVALNIANAVTQIFINRGMDAFMGVLVPGAASFFPEFFYFFAMIGVSCAFILASTWIAGKLADSLSFAMTKKFVKRWLGTGAYYGRKLMTNQDSELNAAQIMGHDNPELTQDSIELANNWLLTFGNFVFGLSLLYTHSFPLTFTLISYVVTIPAFLLISTICYAIAFNIITSVIGRVLKNLLNKERNLESAFHHKIHDIERHSESIALSKGAEYEKTSILQTLKKNRTIRASLVNIRSSLLFVNVFNTQFSGLFPYIVAAPGIRSGKLNLSSMFQISNAYQYVTQFFTWLSDNFDWITSCEVSFKKIKDLNHSITECEEFYKANKNKLVFTVNKKDNNIYIKNLTIKLPNGTTILSNFNAIIPKNKITLLTGESGAGKTSIFLALAGLNPHASGEICGLKPEDLCIIPSNPYFQRESTLLQIITSHQAASKKDVRYIKSLMNRMGLASKIPLLDEVRDWHSNVLSDGQRKRIMLIRGIILIRSMSEPKVLAMDEATKGIDSENKENAEQALKEALPGVTILFSDHNPSKRKLHEKTITLLKPTVLNSPQAKRSLRAK
ncbi:MAG: ATP-binding cassette domain-containing protein [Candidatus Berkiellales bacterium]